MIPIKQTNKQTPTVPGYWASVLRGGDSQMTEKIHWGPFVLSLHAGRKGLGLGSGKGLAAAGEELSRGSGWCLGIRSSEGWELHRAENGNLLRFLRGPVDHYCSVRRRAEVRDGTIQKQRKPSREFRKVWEYRTTLLKGLILCISLGAQNSDEFCLIIGEIKHRTHTTLVSPNKAYSDIQKIVPLVMEVCPGPKLNIM